MDPDQIDLGTIYNVREREKTQYEYEQQFGPVPTVAETQAMLQGQTSVDTSDEGLAANASAAGRMPQDKSGIRPNQSSPSEAVRAKGVAQEQTQTPMAAEVLAKILGFKDADDARSQLAAGKFTVGKAAGATDVTGNILSALSKATAEDSGLPPDLAEKIGAAGGLAAVLFPPGGGKAGKAAGAMKAGAQAMEGTNPSRMVGMAEDVQATIANIGKFNAQRMERGVVTHAETIAKAEQAMPLAEALVFDPTKYDMATLRAAVAGHYAAAASYFTDVAKRVATGDQAAVAEYWSAYAVTADLAVKDALLGTQLGRGLEASKIALSELRAPFAPQELTALAQQLAGAPEAGMDAATHARRMLMLTKGEQKTVMGQTLNLLKNGQNAAYELWINMLLSGPQTHAANMISNASVAAWAPGERVLSATLDFGGDRSVFFGEGPAMVYGGVQGIKDGVRLMAKVIREGTAGGLEKVEIAPSITSGAFGLRPEGFLGSAIDLFGAFVRTPGRALMSEDAFFKAVNYRMELHAQAYREAAQEGLSGKQFSQRMKYIIDHADQFPDVKARADQFALMNTFNRDLADIGRIGEMGQGLTTFANAAPMGRIVLPFIRTPSNILHYASERTPGLNLISDTWRADFAAGGERRALALGKVTAGAMVSAVVGSYAATYIDPEKPTAYMTMVTGAGPKDPTARATLERQGWKPFAVWNAASGEYVQYNRVDPLGMTLGTVATSVEIMGQLPEAGAAEVAMGAVLSVSKAVVSKTYMEGLSNFLDSMEGKPEDIAKFFQSIARSGVPAGVRQTTRTLDPVKRETDTLYDYWRSGLPGYDGPPEHNIWGDEIVFSGGLGPDLVSPIYTSEYKPDATDTWLMNNRVFLPRIPKAVAGRLPAALQMEPETGKEGIRLEPAERSRLGVLIGKGGENIGEPLKQMVAEIIAGPGTDGPDGSKADRIKSVVNLRIRMAVQQLRKEYPDLDQAMTDKVQERLKNKTEGNPAQNLVPTLGR